MVCYKISTDPNLNWNLFTESDPIFSLENGGGITCVLHAVKQEFEDIFGAELVNSHATLAVLPTINGPVTVRKNHLIFLSSGGTRYIQLIYQFAHELCHFMVPDDVCKPYRWFEETLCEAMSWFILQKIYTEQTTRPVSQLLTSYQSMPSYIKNSMNKRISLNDKPLPTVLDARLPQLREDCYIRELNAAIAYEIFPLFWENPDLWKIVPVLNKLQEENDLLQNLNSIGALAQLPSTLTQLLIQRLCK